MSGTVTEIPPGGPSIRDVIDRLTDLEPVDHGMIVSCYLSLEPEQRSTHRYLTQVTSRINELGPTLDALNPAHTVREAVHRDLDRLVDYLRPPRRLPPGRGCALFISEAHELFETVALPTSGRFRLVVDRTPFIQDLVAIDKAFGRILTAVVDRARARIFEVTTTGARELSDLVAVSTRGGRFHSDRADAPGWGEHSYHNRIRTEKKRHFEAVSEELNRLDQLDPPRGIVLAAAGTTATAVQRQLAPALSAKLFGTTHLTPRLATPAKVHAATVAVSATHDRAAERALLIQVGEEIGSGHAVTGLPATLRAVFEGKARALFVRASADAHGFRCTTTGRLVLNRYDCEGEGYPQPTPYLIDDLVEEALRRAIPLTLLHEPDGSDQVADVAARLRYGPAS